MKGPQCYSFIRSVRARGIAATAAPRALRSSHRSGFDAPLPTYLLVNKTVKLTYTDTIDLFVTLVPRSEELAMFLRHPFT